MKTLYQFICERYKFNIRPVVIYGGKFQPFHAGHNEIYEKLCKEFGAENVFISTQDLNTSKLKQKAYTDNHIFTFDEKVEIMTTMFHIPAKQIIKVARTPYLPSWREIPVDGDDYALITIAGQKDIERFAHMGASTMILQEYVPNEELQSCLTHKYFYHVDNTKVHLSATEVRNFFRSGATDEEKRKFFKTAFGGWNPKIYEMVNKRINRIFESKQNDLDMIMEGGVCGHMQHLYNDLGLTFGDISNIIEAGFTGKLESAVEKVDGQPLGMTYRDGEFLFAYSEAPKKLDDLELEFYSELPKKIYRQMCERLIRALQGNPNLNKWFEGNRILQMEVISSEMTNMLKYNRDALIFHYMVTYNDEGKAIDQDRALADEIAEQIDNSNEKITIIGPPHLKLKQMDYSSTITKLENELKKIMKAGKCTENSTLFENIENRIGDWLKLDVTDKQLEMITKKWLGLNKTHQFSEKNYKDPQVREKLIQLDENGEGPKMANEFYDDIKVFITRICLEILKALQTYVATDVVDGKESMKKVLRDAISELQKTGELDSTIKLQQALDRINKLGGEEALFPSEGMLFKYNDKFYKITGMFADYIQVANIIRKKMTAGEYNL